MISASQHRKPQWWVFIGDPLSSRIVVPPQKVSDIPPYTSTKSSSPSSSKPNLTSKTIKLQFPAPPEKCELSLKVYIVSDTYIGCDKVLPVTVSHSPSPFDFNQFGADAYYLNPSFASKSLKKRTLKMRTMTSPIRKRTRSPVLWLWRRVKESSLHRMLDGMMTSPMKSLVLMRMGMPVMTRAIQIVTER